ncbi:MAG: FAD-binding protein, partial [Candidatus Eremiobacteraeota bacterium]|nr:FAD-binding protein [Candidatus Eremiobacteraeota bacterium]
MISPISAHALSPSLEAALRREVRGEVAFDPFTRGLYATDASIYQIEPLGVVIPRTIDDIAATIAICRDAHVPVLPRGAGTSQCGQTVNAAVVLDTSKHLRAVESLDIGARRVRVQPGLVLDHLNAALKRDGLFFPVDPSTASRATLGGMAANNSSGARSLRYGMMVHNVLGIDAILADGTRATFSESYESPLIAHLRTIALREADEIAARFPHVMRRVAGYNINAIAGGPFNSARILVGSEGTLAFFASLELALQPLPRARVLGICHFPRFHDAMATTQELVKTDPVAIELVDRTMLELSRANPAFAPTIERYVQGRPDAILLVEYTGDERDALLPKLNELDERMALLGFPNAVVKVTDERAQSEIWSVRSAGLNIMTSMKGDAKPVSIIEDCAVSLEHLAEYTERLTKIFEKYGTYGTWYAHASVGCLHVRPVLNVKRDEDVGKLRAIAEETFALVREYGGSHSGEHGDGIVRSEFHEEMFGPRIVRAFEEVKDVFDPGGVFNPGKIVRAPRMDDRSLFRYDEDYAPIQLDTVLDWSAWGGLSGAVEMCNNNGACRKVDGVMCPSYTATQDEHDVTRGRANALRLALSGQLGADAYTSQEMYRILDLCVSCKGCRRECPTGVDMARMKIEFLHHYRKKHGWRRKDRIVANLPRYAPYLAWAHAPTRLRNAFDALARAGEKLTGFSARRKIPIPASRPFADDTLRRQKGTPPIGEVVVFVDTFNRYFEPENARAAVRVLTAAQYDVVFPVLKDRGRPLCCGRTYLTAGMVDEAKREAQRIIAALEEPARRGVPIVGLEPSCLLTLRDELLAILPGEASEVIASQAMLFEEFLVREQREGRLRLKLHPLDETRALVHGHCHQKAFGAFPAVIDTLKMIPKLEVVPIESSCCGMAGSFGYEVEHDAISRAMGERSLLPAVRAAGKDT